VNDKLVTVATITKIKQSTGRFLCANCGYFIEIGEPRVVIDGMEHFHAECCLKLKKEPTP
jgi:hypothetical protein